MAAIPVTFQGILFFSDLGVGGGPMPGGPHPSHPIAPGGPPPGFWGGVAPPYVDIGGPGPQPPGSPGQPPLGFWGGRPPPYVDIGGPGPQPHPSHPIVLPPDLPDSLPDPDNRPIEWKAAWHPTQGWVVVGVPQGPVPTPSQ